MAKEDKFSDEMLTDDELDNVAGGTKLETLSDGARLYSRGLISAEDAFSISAVNEFMHKIGYAGYQVNRGKDTLINGKIYINNGNIYTDKSGNVITREQFWKRFDAENGTKIIR